MRPDRHRRFDHVFVIKNAAEHGRFFKLDAINLARILRGTRLVRNFIVLGIDDRKLERIRQYRIKREHALRVRLRLDIIHLDNSVPGFRFTGNANHRGHSTRAIRTSHDTCCNRIAGIRNGSSHVTILARASEHAGTKHRK